MLRTTRSVPRLPILAAVVLLLAAAGCARLGKPMAPHGLPEDAPTVSQILEGLAQNDAAIHNFRAAGAFTLESPDRPGVDHFRRSSILYRDPADLHVIGRKGPVNTVVFRLTSIGGEFIIEFPTEKQYYYELEGEAFQSVPFSVSPADVVRELFLPENWAELPANRVRMLDYDASCGVAQLEVLEGGLRRKPRRRITVQGAPWVVLEHTLLDKKGRTIAHTTRAGYHELDGIRFPTEIEARFPGEQTVMAFQMRNIRLNTEMDPGVFDLDAVKQRLAGHVRLERAQP